MKRSLHLLVAALWLATPAALFASDATTPPATSLPSEFVNNAPGINLPGGGSVMLGTDVVVSSLAGTEAEVTMDINPTNPLNMVACGHAPGFGTMNTFFTTDGGQTWTLVTLGNAQDGITSTFRFDPMVVFDRNGVVYAAYGVRNFDASNVRRETIVVARSNDGGATYTQFAQVSTQNSIGTLPGNDRWGIATGRDPVNANQENVYIAWTQNVNEPALDQRLVISRSTDGGATFSAPVIVADDAISGQDRALTADPGVGPNGEVYVSWHDFGDGQVLVDRSTDGGLTFGTDVLVHTLSFTGLFLNPTPQQDRGVGAGPVLDVDESGGPNNGRVYIAYLDGPVTDTNVFVRRSTDNAATWSAAVRLNDDGGTNSQFLPWVDVDQTSGRVSAIFYDARDDANDRTVHIYHTVSNDGGLTFGANTRVSDNPSNQSQTNPNRYLGNYLEYVGLTSWNCTAYAVWADCSANPSDLDFVFDSIPLGSGASITCPADISVECKQTGGTPATDPAIVAFLAGATAKDACGGTVGYTTDAPTFFPGGETTVTFTNSADATVTCQAKVTIVDTTPPTIACPADTTAECSSHCGVAKSELASWLASFVASDICDDDLTITNNAPDCFPDGVATNVTFTAEDDAGNKASCVAKVTVVDTTPPEIDVVLDRDVLWPPNHKLVEVCAAVTVTDICDPNPTFVLVSITSDEPDNEKGDGNTVDDIQGETIGDDDVCFSLRSERQGTQNGRKYTIVYRASDESGNTADATVCVRVPHDMGAGALASTGFIAGGSAIADGADQFAVIIPSAGTLDAAYADRERIYLGNTAGVIRPSEIRIVDVNNDSRLDLAVFFPAMAATALQGAASFNVNETTDEVEGAIDKKRVGDGPLGIHIVSMTGVDYLVGNIYALGEPVDMPAFSISDVPSPFGGAPEDEPAATAKTTALTSIHPNPFNPQTTVGFTLAGSTRVRIAVYDVTGSLVRRLVDQTMPAGEHRIEWNGVDDAGRGASSGIYFVRMIAGSYTETRKIVMLK